MCPPRFVFFALLTLLTVQITCCQSRSTPALSGKIILKTGWRPVLYLVRPNVLGDVATSYTGTVLDSALVSPDGSFAFGRFEPAAEPTLYELCIQPVDSRFPNKRIDDDPETANYLPLVLTKGEAIHLEAESDRLQASAVLSTYSSDNRALFRLRDLRRASFDAQLRGPSGEAHANDEALLEQAARLEQYRLPLMAFADSTAAFLPALLAIRWTSPDGDYERVPEFLRRQCRRWQTVQHSFARQLCGLAAPGKLPLMVGDTMPDFDMPLASGDTVALQTLLGKRLTLIDLWASWCAPCRRENREVLAPLWDRYRSSGLAIVGYALDSSPGTWKAAIQKDAAGWTHASHLGGDSSPFLDTLHVTTIPANFLLDAGGKVVAKNLHGEALREFLSNYFGN